MDNGEEEWCQRRSRRRGCRQWELGNDIDIFPYIDRAV